MRQAHTHVPVCMETLNVRRSCLVHRSGDLIHKHWLGSSLAFMFGATAATMCIAAGGACGGMERTYCTSRHAEQSVFVFIGMELIASSLPRPRFCRINTSKCIPMLCHRRYGILSTLRVSIANVRLLSLFTHTHRKLRRYRYAVPNRESYKVAIILCIYLLMPHAHRQGPVYIKGHLTDLGVVCVLQVTC
jgi:hypothetical protein